MEINVARCTRRCHKTERELAPGEAFYSALVDQGAEVIRCDYSQEAWEGPPEGAVAWWQSRMPTPDSHKLHWAPNDVMLDLLDRLEQHPEQADLRYVLALLLLRRRVIRLEESHVNENGQEQLAVYAPKSETTWQVNVVPPSETRIEEIQQELAKLLFADAA